jgi:hypothetical protein
MNEFENIIALPETHLFEFINKHQKRSWKHEADRKLLATKWINFYTIAKFPINHKSLENQLINKAKNWRDLFEITLEQYRKEHYPDLINPIWIEKSPPHVFYQPDIHSLFPESRFIYLIRDPRAVIGSLKTMPWSTSNVYTLARSWKIATNKFKMNNQSVVIQYESIVKDPEKELRKLFEFLGLSGTFKLAKQVEDSVEKQNFNSANALKPISTEHLEKWRNQLSRTDSDQEIIEFVCMKEMLQYGYQPENLPKNKRFYLNLCTQKFKFAVLKFFG